MTENRTYGQRYEIRNKIARGGMADVFYAQDKLLDRPVALKVLFPELSVDPSFVERFRREAQNAARLSHPNIVSVYDWGEDANTYYIVMELVEGKSLSTILHDDTKLSPTRAAEIGADTASALAFAHQNGVVHRDVKPGNILIDGNGNVKVTDFGIARARNTTENLTQTGAVMGTATYFSPEQAQGLAVDQRSDVYSLGVVLYEMVTGKPPFAGDNPVTIAYKHVRESPEALSSIDAAIPASFQSIVAQALTKAPANRYATAEDLRADLLRFSKGQPVEATRVDAAAGEATQAVSATQVNNATRAYTQAAAQPRPQPPRDRKPKKRFVGPLLTLLGLLFLIFLLTYLVTFGFDRDTSATVVVPNIVGQNVDDATSALDNAGLKTKVTNKQDGSEQGTVLSQTPAAEQTVRRNSTVTLTVSSGAGQPQSAEVPNVVGFTQEAAARSLSAAGFSVSTTRQESSRPAGSVIETSPDSGAKLAKGSTVVVVVSSGRATTTSSSTTTTTRPTTTSSSSTTTTTAASGGSPLTNP